MKTKKMSGGSLDGAKGGSGKMFGKSGVAPMPAGVSAVPKQQAFGKEMLKGGPGGVMGKQGGSRPAMPGGVSVAKSGAGSNKDFSVHGGKSRMAGKGTAANARPR
jgi:hypothetical protein